MYCTTSIRRIRISRLGRRSHGPCTSVTWTVMRGRAAAVMVDGVGLRPESMGPDRDVVKTTHRLGIKPDDVTRPAAGHDGARRRAGKPRPGMGRPGCSHPGGLGCGAAASSIRPQRTEASDDRRPRGARPPLAAAARGGPWRVTGAQGRRCRGPGWAQVRRGGGTSAAAGRRRSWRGAERRRLRAAARCGALRQAAARCGQRHERAKRPSGAPHPQRASRGGG
jgi:hypothetical protein